VSLLEAGSAYIEPGSPWQNAYVKSFGSRLRDELLAVELFSCLAEAQVLIEDWRQDYNHRRPLPAARDDDAERVRRRLLDLPTGCQRRPPRSAVKGNGSLEQQHSTTTSSHAGRPTNGVWSLHLMSDADAKLLELERELEVRLISPADYDRLAIGL
jgi:Integrase core domain